VPRYNRRGTFQQCAKEIGLKYLADNAAIGIFETMVSLRRPLAAFLSGLPSAVCTRRTILTVSASFVAAGTRLETASSSSCIARNMETPPHSGIDTGYLDAASAAALDEELMSTPGFTLEQLMELAGLSVAEAVYTVALDKWPSRTTKDGKPKVHEPRILIVCGPGNNGGDGLVAARHLCMFGCQCIVAYPKRSSSSSSSRQPHYQNLVKQCENVGIPVHDDIPSELLQGNGGGLLIVDAIFGFSFQGEPREPFATMLLQIKQAQKERGAILVSVDVPSGWNVDHGDISGQGLVPDVLVSLTAPKQSARSFTGRHFIGGRFLPPALAEKYSVRMPPYPGVQQVMEVASGENANWGKEYFDYLADKEGIEKYVEGTPRGAETWQEQYAAYLADKEMAERQNGEK
jgi:hydroxyethylthiazole kinase-like uncharacterized protein yjeF